MAHDAQSLIAELKEKGVLRSPSVMRALQKIDRVHFVPQELKHIAYKDAPLPIGSGQTISQPYTVIFMLERLDVQPGATVLEIGYGSGWQTALLAQMVGRKGKVYAMEVLTRLCALGEKNLRHYPSLLPRTHLRCQNASAGWHEGAPFERIIAAAEVKEVPAAWREQLRAGGKMIYPQSGSLVLEAKHAGGFDLQKFPGFAFVPFT